MVIFNSYVGLQEGILLIIYIYIHIYINIYIYGIIMYKYIYVYTLLRKYLGYDSGG